MIIFVGGTKRSHVMVIYANDSWLRNKILTLLEPIEIKMRTQISHYLGITYGSDVFYQKHIYKKENIWQTISDNFSNEAFRNKLDPVIKHHTINYGGIFPIWVIVEYLSFNTLSKYFNNLHENDKKNIAKNAFGLNEYILGQWLHVLGVLRNICAHYGYFYRRIFPLRPIIAKSTGWDPTKDNKLFAMFLVMRQLSDEPSWKIFILTVQEKEKTSPYFKLKDFGFPNDWQRYLS